MNKSRKVQKISFLLIFVLFFAIPFCFSQEEITLTTYYPSPYGIYFELRADKLAVGSSYRGVTTLADGELIVSNSLGVGTNNPTYQLTVGTAAEGEAFGVSGSGDVIVTGGTDSNWMLYKPAGVGKIGITSTGRIDLVGNTYLNGGLSIGNPSPQSTFEINGSSNICVQKHYTAASGSTNCPAGFYITIPTTVTPSGPPGYFLCCRTCPNTEGANNDGRCD